MARADNVVTINFRATGDKTLRSSINLLNKAIQSLENKSKSLGDQGDNLRNKNRILSQSFATLRSNMLLYQFAMGLGIRQLILFTKEAAKIQTMETAFSNLSGGTLEASVAMEKLQEATDGTMTQFDLLQQANNAMILGVTTNSDEMGRMFDMAQRLGAALGKDTRQSIESLITGMGRQSKLMLDNIGIMVDTNKAYKDFAAANKTSVDALTDSQRKQAFMNATLDAGQRKLDRLGKEVLSADAHFQRFAVASSELANDIGESLLPLVEPLADAMVALSKAVDPAVLKRFATSVLLTASALGIAKVATMGFLNASLALYGSLLTLRTLMLTHPVTFIAGAMTTAIAGVLSYFDAFEDGNKVTAESIEKQIKLEQSVQNSKNAFEAAKKAYNESGILQIKLSEALGDLTANQAKQAIIEEKRSILTKELNDLDKNSMEGKARLMEINNALVELEIQDINLTKDILKATNDEIDSNKKRINQKIELQNKLEEEILLLEARNLHFDDDIKFAEAEIAIMQRQMSLMTDALDIKKIQLEIDLKQKEIDKAKNEILSEQNELTKALKGSFNSLSNTLVEAAVNGRHMGDAISGALKKIATQIAVKGAVFGLINVLTGGGAGALLGGFGSFAFGGIAHSGGLIQNNRIQKFANGGVVEGEDNVPILAQNGEFVMSRSAVESVGIETMNRINQTGNAGVTVNVTGNVMSQDYVEGELAELISEAVRKGTNYGL
tara:strand:- start:874 stop:3051 length:2178 start_codon:yes stop_codon:yes gene_type:complete